MKRFIFVISALLAGSLYAQEEAPKWTFSSEYFNSRNGRIDNSGNGFDLNISQPISYDYIKPVYGFTRVTFDSVNYNRIFAANDVAASAAYVGAIAESDAYNNFSVFGKLDLGVSFLENTEASTASLPGTYFQIDDEEDLYLAFGAGVKYQINDKYSASLGYSRRDFGSYEDSIDLKTDNWNIGIQVKF